jgi:hypothetical protein
VFDEGLNRIETEHKIMTIKDGPVMDLGVKEVNYLSSELKEIPAKNKKQWLFIMIILPLLLIAIDYLISFVKQLSITQLDFALSNCEQ